VGCAEVTKRAEPTDKARRRDRARLNEQGERKRNHGRSLVKDSGENRKGDVSNMS
jgi:hypothetical protein